MNTIVAKRQLGRRPWGVETHAAAVARNPAGGHTVVN